MPSDNSDLFPSGDIHVKKNDFVCCSWKCLQENNFCSMFCMYTGEFKVQRMTAIH